MAAIMVYAFVFWVINVTPTKAFKMHHPQSIRTDDLSTTRGIILKLKGEKTSHIFRGRIQAA